MFFVGIDLAWSPKNKTGVAVLEGNKREATLKTSALVTTDAAIAEHVKDAVSKKPAFVAVDAPLIIPNETGRRVADELTSKLFGQYNAGAHPANRARFLEWGRIRGEDLSELLEKQGFDHEIPKKPYEASRKFFEVYPHPSMVVLFDLETVIPYKKKPGRNDEDLREAFEKYQKHLRSLEKAKPKLVLPKEIVRTNVRGLRGQKLKNYEDRLDAIFCAYIAYYAWACPDKCAMLGSKKEGYIYTPVSEQIRKKLVEIQSQKKLCEF